MIIDSLLSRARDSIARRKRFNRMVAEVNALSSRDLADLRADRAQMLYDIRKEIYG